MYPIFWLILPALMGFSSCENHTAMRKPDRNAYLHKMECGDCKKVNEECEIVSSGFFCREEEDSDQIDSRKGVAVELLHLRQCMGPDHFFFNREEISSACCFWTPEMGCQQVKNKERTKPCSDCATYHERGSFLDLNPMGCPCGPREISGTARTYNYRVFIIILICGILCNKRH